MARIRHWRAPTADPGSREHEPAARHASLDRVRRGWRPHVLWTRSSRPVATLCQLREQDSKGREAWRLAGPATQQVRTRDQREDGKGDRPDDPAVGSAFQAATRKRAGALIMLD